MSSNIKGKIYHRPRLDDLTVFHGMVTRSQTMRTFFRMLQRVARADATVLIRGETGTGKELVARALHQLSPRAERPFAALNCATLTSELLASELFGHVRGAFTGAVRDRQGLFAQGDGGTVFLDEVAEIDLEIQARLLRVLQERTFVPLGGTQPRSVDVRVVSATHTSLRLHVERRRFREDLMYRIRVVPLFLPPLRERPEDIEALIWHFIDELNSRGLREVDGLDSQTMEAMKGYLWPGNIRELLNAVEHAFAIGEGPIITLDELPPELRGEELPESASDRSERELERVRIVEALAEAGGKKGRAAEVLGMSRSTLWRKMREHGLI
ncbi:MAG: sigma-54-dependent Fis family transcriptional regulator [Proteobacteria bacterium]|nr:MAG: sigma-54-dependent Fis family transcriptional regulator [Pseudomonadota bacterium]